VILVVEVRWKRREKGKEGKEGRAELEGKRRREKVCRKRTRRAGVGGNRYFLFWKVYGVGQSFGILAMRLGDLDGDDEIGQWDGMLKQAGD
jgi:hypothetical protein